MISGCERLVLVQRLCNEVSEVFIDGTFKCGAESVLKCTIYMYHAMCTFFGFVLLPQKSIFNCMWSATVCNSYTMGCPHINGDNPRALASELSYVQVGKHGITILNRLH